MSNVINGFISNEIYIIEMPKEILYRLEIALWHIEDFVLNSKRIIVIH